MGHFTPELFQFLSDLAANNNREWFDANRERYREVIQEPALEFITDFGPRLQLISPHFKADARVQGGSLFRIHRDTRFSPDKTPYKTNTGLHFRHERARDAHAPGFYLHLQPGECFTGMGLWHPEAKVALKIREAIASDPEGWARVAHLGRFPESFALTGDSLKRPPRGFDPDHQHVEDLMRKDFMGITRLDQAEVTSGGFIDRFEALCQDGASFTGFLCRAVGVPF